MARIAGVELPANKRVDIALTYIFGIGRSSARKIVDKAKVEPSTRMKDLSDDEMVRIREVLDKDFKVEGEVRTQVSQDIKRLMEIGCYRGIRHRKGMPVHGQRTSTNAKTRKTLGGHRVVARKTT